MLSTSIVEKLHFFAISIFAHVDEIATKVTLMTTQVFGVKKLKEGVFSQNLVS